ncbi:cytochrome c oxidase subunit II [Altererythrobacter sp. ZODW24]|uniref:cytochrome c oxidase subunit II n=1 Tax=Altererythrobacter sp. ZODW24 TaxID=2185142 RepID=UPI000DF864DA|nr:cytochrome c oxidase subunit II [Altererythrobacter sp. ZODW24]
MTIGINASKFYQAVLAVLLVFGLAFASTAAFAQDSAATEPAPVTINAETVAGEEAAEPAADAAYTPMKPTEGKGMPIDGAYGFQDQYSPNGQYARWMHDAILIPVIFAISIFVLFLLLWVVARYNKRANKVPSKTTHNTLIEVAWTLIPVLVLVGIAIPSITLLAKQYESPPEDAVTIKVTGYQWYWGYSYPDLAVEEFVSNMSDEETAAANGEPFQLAVDNRMVVPVGEVIRLQITGADVIHSFAVPSLWVKMDAVPGRLNERTMLVKEPGVYYGQCMELCGARHGYMPIVVEALPRPQFDAWVRSQGGNPAGVVEEAAEEPAAEAEVDAEADTTEEATTEDAAAEAPAA